ncbi:hypothetical protein SLA2020_495840 [Shorea laevis]
MASGFTAGGAPDFFSGRSTTMTNQPQHPHPTYRSQLPDLLMDPPIQIASQQAAASSLIGKRILADFGTSQSQNPAGLNSLYLRSVKPRGITTTPPLYPLYPPLIFPPAAPPVLLLLRKLLLCCFRRRNNDNNTNTNTSSASASPSYNNTTNNSFGLNRLTPSEILELFRYTIL